MSSTIKLIKLLSRKIYAGSDVNLNDGNKETNKETKKWLIMLLLRKIEF